MNKLSLEVLEDINNRIILYCRSKSLLIDTVIWCPHHPHKGFASENKLLKTDCFCRKPNPGMLFELSYQRNIDLNSSLFVGDSLVDSQAANSAGCEFRNINDL
jgi:D-glycero-D-manno-heptose 1,7-bisphosphate phosphatase